MSSQESLGRNNESEKKSQNVTPEESLKSDVAKLPEEQRKLIGEIMVAKSVLREAYIDNMEGGFDGLNLALDGNYTSVNSVLNKIEANMFDLNKDGNYYRQFKSEVANLRSDIYNYELKGKDKNKVILSDLKALDTTAAQFVLSLERAQIKPVKKEVKSEDLKEVTPEVKAKEKVKEVVDADMNSILLKLDPSIDSFEVTTDMLNRSQEMRFVYSSEGYESVDRFNGDQILLKTLLKDLSVGGSTLKAMGEAFKNPTKEQLNSLTDIQVTKLIKIYQKATGLKVDGKFGPSTFNSLVRSAEKSGYKIVDRSKMIKESDEYKDNSRFASIRSGKVYSKKVRRKKAVNKAKNGVSGSVNKSLENSQSFYETEVKLRKAVEVGFENLLGDDELRGAVLELFVHYNGNTEVFMDSVNLNKERTDRIVYALESGDQNFQTEALLKVLKPTPVKEEESSSFGEKAAEVFDNVVSSLQEGQKETKEEKSPVEDEGNGSSSNNGSYTNGRSPLGPL